ncbi:MAG: cupin domain-containing protein [Desulfobacterales bacterium]|nr:MAG: cupin domain-containing protein [Desulfobacterales bacterium]
MMKPKVFSASEVDWIEAPGHFSAFSKLLVNEDTGSKYFDFRVSSYQPRGYCEVHTHETAENIYYILQGEGIVELDGERHLVGPKMVVFVPPGVAHGIKNTGFEDLIFIVMASPPKDMPRPK